MTAALTRESAAAAVAAAVAERDTIQANLLDLDGSFGKRLLAGANLTGVTKQRWDATAAGLTTLWETFTAYSAVVDRAAEALAGAGRSPGRALPELATLLNGPSVRLTRAASAVARGDLLRTADANVTPAEAVQLRDVLNCDPLALWPSGPGHLGGPGRQVGRVDTARLDRLREQAAAAVSRADELAALRENSGRRIAAVTGAVSAARDAWQDAMTARDRTAAKIAAELPAPPDLGGLTGRLAALASVRTGADLIEASRGAVSAAQEAVAGLGELPGSSPWKDPPSATFVSAVMTTEAVTLCWLGDSRAYWLAAGPDSAAWPLTRDDSVAGEMVAAGLLSEADALALPQAHVVTGWVGADHGDAAPHVARFEPPGPGVLLLCSDGLWNYQPEAAKLAELALPQALTDPLGAAAGLVRFALDAGGVDNVTVVLAPFPLTSVPTRRPDEPAAPAPPSEPEEKPTDEPA